MLLKIVYMSNKERLLSLLIMLIFTLCIQAQSKQALLVGISNYSQSGEDAWVDIHGANDVEMLYPTLKTQGFQITKLCNKVAKADKIRKEIASLIESSHKGDVVYIHFSMHGQPVEDLDNDESDEWDEAIIPFDAKKTFQLGVYEGANHITDDELHKYFQELREVIGIEGFLCVVFDACHAGSSFRGEEDEDDMFLRGSKRGFTPNNKEYRPRINAQGHFEIPTGSALADVVILEACRSYQSNYEIKQDGVYYGPLSFYINEILSTMSLSPNMDWILNVKQLMDADKRLVRQNMVYETSLNN